MTSAIGWYGPLIDLSRAASHLGHFVQLLVFVHRSTPVQYKLSKGGEVIRTDIQVGDDTRPYFSVSLWQKHMRSMAVAGDVILLQNVKIIINFGDVIEARTVQCSSLVRLIHPFKSLLSKGADDLIAEFQVGITTKEKLVKVIEWVQQAGSTLHSVRLQDDQQRRQLLRNWKVLEESKSLDCFSLSKVSHLTNSCKASFNASVGEIFLPITWRVLHESENEKMFISQRLSKKGDNNLVDDLICTGCRLCGSPMALEYGSLLQQNAVPLYCKKSSDRLHVVSSIYRPFMLYVWDESEYLPLLVRNKAADHLFGNITAERVYLCCRGQKHDRNPNLKGVVGFSSSDVYRSLEGKEKHQCDRNMNFYQIWLILLKMLLQQGNGPLKFEVTVNASLDRENGRFEMISMSIPCFRNRGSSN